MRSVNTFLIGLLNMSITAGIITVAVVCVRFLMRKAPKAFSYALWSVVLIRLLCPISFSTGLSVFNLLGVETTDGSLQYISESSEGDEKTVVSGTEETHYEIVQSLDTQGYGENDGAFTVINADGSSTQELSGVDAEAENGDGSIYGMHSADEGLLNEERLSPNVITGNGGQNPAVSEKASGENLLGENDDGSSAIGNILFCVWLAGVLLILAVNVFSVTRLRQKTAASLRLQGNVYICDEIATPFCLGILKARIYLPSNLDEKERTYVIRHEQYHIRRFDNGIKLLAFIALSLHWFNPLVWLAFVLAGRDMEMSCDEAVMKQASEDIRAEYSAALLKLATGRKFAALPLAFGDGNPKERIKNIMSYKKPTLWIILAAVVACILLFVALGTNPRRDNAGDAAEGTQVIDKGNVGLQEGNSDSTGNNLEDELSVGNNTAGNPYNGQQAELTTAGNVSHEAGWTGKNGGTAMDLSAADLSESPRTITVNQVADGTTTGTDVRTISGWELPQEEMTPEEIEAWLEVAAFTGPEVETDIKYELDEQYRTDPEQGFDVFDYSTITCYKVNEPVWTVNISDFWVESVIACQDGVYALGNTYVFSSEQKRYAYFAKINAVGQIVFTCRMDHDIAHEYLVKVIDNGDGTCTAFSYGAGSDCICLSRFDAYGTELFSRKISLDTRIGLQDAICLGEDYLVKVTVITDPGKEVFYRLDREGNLLGGFCFEGDDCMYYIEDMTEYGGKLYFSAYAVPIQKDAGGRDEIAGILSHISEKGIMNGIESEELTAALRENYTAVLLQCDADNGVPITCYTVNGALGSILALNKENRLVWHVQSILSSRFSLFTSAYSIAGDCKDYQYFFETGGSPVEARSEGKSCYYR